MKKIIALLLLVSCKTTQPCPDVTKSAFLEISSKSWQMGYMSGANTALSAVVDTSINFIWQSNKDFEEFYFLTDSILNSQK